LIILKQVLTDSSVGGNNRTTTFEKESSTFSYSDSPQIFPLDKGNFSPETDYFTQLDKLPEWKKDSLGSQNPNFRQFFTVEIIPGPKVRNFHISDGYSRISGFFSAQFHC